MPNVLYRQLEWQLPGGFVQGMNITMLQSIRNNRFCEAYYKI